MLGRVSRCYILYCKPLPCRKSKVWCCLCSQPKSPVSRLSVVSQVKCCATLYCTTCRVTRTINPQCLPNLTVQWWSVSHQRSQSCSLGGCEHLHLDHRIFPSHILTTIWGNTWHDNTWPDQNHINGNETVSGNPGWNLLSLDKLCKQIEQHVSSCFLFIGIKLNT